MREFKKGDWVIWVDRQTMSLYKKIAKIIYIEKEGLYLLEFKKNIRSHHDGGGRGKYNHCKWGRNHKIKLDIDHLKFKKWIKG